MSPEMEENMSRMQVALLSTALVGCLVVAGSPNASAGPIDLTHPGFSAVIDPFQFTFNEAGPGSSYISTATTGTTPATIIASPPGSGLGLIYALPQAVVAGFVTFTEPAASGGGMSEVLWFTDAAGHTSGITDAATARMIYYSDLTVGEPILAADVGFPTMPAGSTIFADGPEVGSEGNNGFTYSPGGPYPGNNVYIATSDFTPTSVVPEPATLALFGAGLLALGLIGRRRKRPAQAA